MGIEISEEQVNGKEVVDMCKAVGEIREEGRIEGEKALLKNLIEKKMAKKYSVEQISAMLEIDVSEVENIMKEIQNEKYL